MAVADASPPADKQGLRNEEGQHVGGKLQVRPLQVAQHVNREEGAGNVGGAVHEADREGEAGKVGPLKAADKIPDREGILEFLMHQRRVVMVAKQEIGGVAG